MSLADFILVTILIVVQSYDNTDIIVLYLLFTAPPYNDFFINYQRKKNNDMAEVAIRKVGIGGLFLQKVFTKNIINAMYCDKNLFFIKFFYLFFSIKF